jgi:Major royal jelly protein
MTTGLMAVSAAADAASGAAAGLRLEIVAQSRSMIWNAVAVGGQDIFVAGPRWTGSQGPAVARLDSQGEPKPYPDAAWNAWREGADPAMMFVDVNALHADGKGALWVVDTGSPQFGGDPLPGGAKLVQIGLANGRVDRVIAFGPEIALPGSYVDDVWFRGDFAYLTDAGRPGVIVVDLASDDMRRVLENIPATTARDDRPIVVDGVILNGPDGRPLRVHADPMEVSPDGEWFYFGALEGPWYRIATRWLDDFSSPAEVLAAQVEPWADLPPVGGTAMDANGDLYFTELATNTLKRRSANGQVTTILQDPRLHWADAPTIDDEYRILLPVPQLDRAAIFHGGRPQVQWPITLYRLKLPTIREHPEMPR